MLPRELKSALLLKSQGKIKLECEQEWTTYIQILFFFLNHCPKFFQHYAVSTQNLSTFYSAEIVRDVGE